MLKGKIKSRENFKKLFKQTEKSIDGETLRISF